MKKSLFAVSMLSLGFMACSKGGDGAAPSPQELYKSDKAKISQLPSSGAEAADQVLNNAFSKIFGGTQGYHVSSYIDQRIVRVWNDSDLNSAQVYPSDLGTSRSWLSGDDDPKPKNDDVQTIATNVGTALWVMGKIENKQVSVQKGSEYFTLTSPREGLVTLGKAYAASISANGRNIQVPPEYRIATIVHEARHSDCTGGFSKSYVEKANKATSYNNFLDLIGTKQLTCGHLHIECPSYHEYAGHSACDKEAFGAYGVGAVYLLGSVSNYNYGTVEREIIEYGFKDEMSRLIDHSDDDFFSTSPDMSSSHD